MSRASKRLSWLLRHGAGEAGLSMDEAGWANVDEVLAAAGMSRHQLDEVVRDNDKSRFQVDGQRIRAAQGHSVEGMPITREALEASWQVYQGPDPIWHGTRASVLESIGRQGLLPGARTHVHLAETTDSHVGKRANVSVLLAVSVTALRQAGQEVWVSPSGVVLVREVPAACIVELRCLSRKARAREAELRAALGL